MRDSARRCGSRGQLPDVCKTCWRYFPVVELLRKSRVHPTNAPVRLIEPRLGSPVLLHTVVLAVRSTPLQFAPKSGRTAGIYATPWCSRCGRGLPAAAAVNEAPIEAPAKCITTLPSAPQRSNQELPPGM